MYWQLNRGKQNTCLHNRLNQFDFMQQVAKTNFFFLKKRDFF